jgi:four helix bundle protein
MLVVSCKWSVVEKFLKHLKGGRMGRTDFENLRVYNLSEQISDLIWDIVAEWERFARDTIGRQLVNAADSIGANIAEGTGRGSFADNRRFARIARGSLYEVKHWLRRAYRRRLLTDHEVAKLQNIIEELTPKLSAYIRSIGEQNTTKNA